MVHSETSCSKRHAIILCIAFRLLAAFGASHAADGPQTVVDYYRLLPPHFKEYYADIASAPQLKADIPNGYLAITARGLEEPLFEMALFRDARGEALLVVTSLQRDPVCTFHRSYALRCLEGVWRQEDVLPQPGMALFFGRPEDAALLQRLPGLFEYHYHPPRYGTALGVSLNPLCETEAETRLNEADYQRVRALRPASEILRFCWDRERGVFVDQASKKNCGP